MKKIISIIIIFLCANTIVQAQENTSYELEQHIIYYNVFNSSLITPEVAKTYNLIRAKDQAYVNIALVKKSGGNGIPANINGYHRNLMQQKFPLKFIEIKEATATYYLAPLRFNNEDILHIDIEASNIEGTDSGKFTITKKLYKD
ncbi:MAG: DUF4426 domain-containing protein [Cellvibrionaceae bacterium]